MDLIALVDIVTRELMLFAAVGMLIGGIDDLAVDALFVVRRLFGFAPSRLAIDALPGVSTPSRLAIFVPAWDEAGVVDRMIETTLTRLDHDNYRLYVGTYPNDPATIAAVRVIAGRDARVRLVVGTHAGPTTKADCLNTLWQALIRADSADGTTTRAVIIHDAEDLVHPAELRIIDALLTTHQVVQLPVLPLIQRDARMVAGVHADEFAESHTRAMVVRTALGAAMPLAGTGCAIDVGWLRRVADERGGVPFDADSLVEDYELGLRLAELGARGIFARVADGESIVAVRSYFPATMDTAVRQKARWIMGIALAGWDRTGWASRTLALGCNWMRLRDRRTPIAMAILAAAYSSMLLLSISAGVHAWRGTAPAVDMMVADWLLIANFALLVWRLLARMAFTGRLYGTAEAFRSIPRFLVGNVIALAATYCALRDYVRYLTGEAPKWDKTEHEFPDLNAVPL